MTTIEFHPLTNIPRSLLATYEPSRMSHNIGARDTTVSRRLPLVS